MIVSVLILLVSIAALAVSSDKFVDGAVSLSRIAGLPPVVVGAVVIGFGTSLPEAIASGIAAYNGNIDVAVGNVLGSNTANLSLVLATSAVFAAIPFVFRELRREFLMMFACWLWFAVSILDGFLSRWEGLVALALALSAIVYSVVRPAPQEVEITADGEESGSVAKLIAVSVFWLLILAAAAHFLVSSSLSIATDLGLSGGFAGAVLVAVGTSLPEVFTAAASARRKDFQMLAGNLLGSNLFNAGIVGGLAATVGPGLVPSMMSWQLNGIALGVAAAVTILSITRQSVSRLSAAPLLGAFVFFLVVAARM